MPVLVLTCLCCLIHCTFFCSFCYFIPIRGIIASNLSDFKQLDIKHKGRADTAHISQMGPNSGGPQVKKSSLPHLRLKVFETFGVFPLLPF